MYPNINRGDRKRERQWRHRERNRKRERRSWDTVKEENTSLFLTECLSVSLTKIRVHSPFWFYQSKKQKREDDTNFSVKNEKVPSTHRQRLQHHHRTLTAKKPASLNRQYSITGWVFFFFLWLFPFCFLWFLIFKNKILKEKTKILH